VISLDDALNASGRYLNDHSRSEQVLLQNWHRVAYQTRDASCKRRVCIPTGGEVSQKVWTGTKRRPLNWQFTSLGMR